MKPCTTGMTNEGYPKKIPSNFHPVPFHLSILVLWLDLVKGLFFFKGTLKVTHLLLGSPFHLDHGELMFWNGSDFNGFFFEEVNDVSPIILLRFKTLWLFFYTWSRVLVMYANEYLLNFCGSWSYHTITQLFWWDVTPTRKNKTWGPKITLCVCVCVCHLSFDVQLSDRLYKSHKLSMSIYIIWIRVFHPPSQTICCSVGNGALPKKDKDFFPFEYTQLFGVMGSTEPVVTTPYFWVTLGSLLPTRFDAKFEDCEHRLAVKVKITFRKTHKNKKFGRKGWIVSLIILKDLYIYI